MINWIISFFIAHIIMPFLCTGISIFLMEYWSRYLFDFSPSFDMNHTVSVIFWTVFIIAHIKFAIDWWFVREFDF